MRMAAAHPIHAVAAHHLGDTAVRARHPKLGAAPQPHLARRRVRRVQVGGDVVGERHVTQLSCDAAVAVGGDAIALRRCRRIARRGFKRVV